MKTVFADTLYWVATVKPDDPWSNVAKAAKAALGEVFIVTTDEVLTEFLAALSKGEHMRKQAAKMVQAILENPHAFNLGL